MATMRKNISIRRLQRLPLSEKASSGRSGPRRSSLPERHVGRSHNDHNTHQNGAAEHRHQITGPWQIAGHFPLCKRQEVWLRSKLVLVGDRMVKRTRLPARQAKSCRHRLPTRRRPDLTAGPGLGAAGVQLAGNWTVAGVLAGYERCAASTALSWATACRWSSTAAGVRPRRSSCGSRQRAGRPRTRRRQGRDLAQALRP
jgi:hypothetical protein